MLEVSVEDAMVVEVVDGVEDRADDRDSVVLGRLALCEDAVEEFATGGEFKRHFMRDSKPW